MPYAKKLKALFIFSQLFFSPVAGRWPQVALNP
jgi:hypothetical protein